MADLEEDHRSSIVIRLVSAEDIRAFNFFQKLSIFAVATIAADEEKSAKPNHLQRQRSPTDRENDGFPEWNHEFRFVLDSDLDSDLEFVHIDLRHEGAIFGIGDRTVGEVRIPVKDLTDEASSGGVLRIVRYQVRSSDGKANGVLNLSYRFISNSRKVVYPRVEEVPNLELIDSSLSCYSSRIMMNTTNESQSQYFWDCSPNKSAMNYYNRELFFSR